MSVVYKGMGGRGGEDGADWIGMSTIAQETTSSANIIATECMSTHLDMLLLGPALKIILLGEEKGRHHCM